MAKKPRKKSSAVKDAETKKEKEVTELSKILESGEELKSDQMIDLTPSFKLFDNITENAFNVNYDNLPKYLTSDLNSYFNISHIYPKETASKKVFFQDSSLDNQLKLADEINELRKKLKKSADDLNVAKADRENKNKSLVFFLC